jgi:hypothetical protein
MTEKPSFTFQPAPRPQPRSSAADTQALQEATKDLGFGRVTSAPADSTQAAAGALVGNEVENPEAKPVITPMLGAKIAKRSAEVPKHGPALKFSVPDEVWNELRLEALKRRVTVKFLVLEALAAKGYAIDLDAIPEDGRRIR